MGTRSVVASIITALSTILLALPTNSIRLEPTQSPPTTVAPIWLTERVDAPQVFREMSDHSLVIDVAGHAHIAYGADFLYYAAYDGSAWQVQTVDDSGYVGQYAALVLDTAGRPHISYYDVVRGSLKYAYFDDRWWHIFTIDSGLGLSGGYTSLALTAEGQPRISYYDGTNAALKYAMREGSTWATETVETGLGRYDYDRGRTSLALDGADLPHIAYYDATNARVKYAHHDGITWQIESIDGVGPNGNPPSLALDSGGQPHIVYCDGTDVKYASYDGLSWQRQVVTGPASECLPSLALDDSDHPHVAVFVGRWISPYRLYYAHHDGIAWTVQLVADGPSSGGGYPAVGLDSTGQPRIIYLDGDDGELRYASYEGGVWQIEAVDSAAYVGWYASSAIDSHGHPHIAYCRFSPRRDTCQAVKYAYHDGTAWQIETVIAGDGIGDHLSLALDAADQPHISFCEGPADHCYYLRYAHRDTGTWHVEYVDTTGQVGDDTSIAVDSAGRPHIAYQVYSQSPPPNLLEDQGQAIDVDLKYAYFDGTTWQLQIVDTAGYAGNCNSLALDDQDHPHIA